MKSDELKVYKGDVTIPVYGTIADAEVYLKYEADKVIAEKDKEIAELNEQFFQLQDTAIKVDKKLTETQKQLRHQKYIRCLAMAMWCDSEANYWYDSSKVQQCCRYGHYISWFNKWSKLADKFKEAK